MSREAVRWPRLRSGIGDQFRRRQAYAPLAFSRWADAVIPRTAAGGGDDRLDAEL
jgi:hypothetical protein